MLACVFCSSMAYINNAKSEEEQNASRVTSRKQKQCRPCHPAASTLALSYFCIFIFICLYIYLFLHLVYLVYLVSLYFIIKILVSFWFVFLETGGTGCLGGRAGSSRCSSHFWPAAAAAPSGSLFLLSVSSTCAPPLSSFSPSSLFPPHLSSPGLTSIPPPP